MGALPFYQRVCWKFIFCQLNCESVNATFWTSVRRQHVDSSCVRCISGLHKAEPAGNTNPQINTDSRLVVTAYNTHTGNITVTWQCLHKQCQIQLVTFHHVQPFGIYPTTAELQHQWWLIDLFSQATMYLNSVLLLLLNFAQFLWYVKPLWTLAV